MSSLWFKPKLKASLTISLAALLLISFFCFIQCKPKSEVKMGIDIQAQEIIDAMLTRFDKSQEARIITGVVQVQKAWRDEDGTVAEMQNFCLNNFCAEQSTLDQSFDRLESTFENINGLLLELRRALQWNLDVNTGPILPLDYLTANFNLGAHVEDDLYQSKVAFFVLLNFKVYSLAECLKEGGKWSRQKWAEVRLAQHFIARVPASVKQQIHEAFVSADNYISNYNIYMGNLLTPDDQRLFPEDLKLISHWGLRDELKAQYSEPDGLPRQELIYAVMQKIITQEIPAQVIDNPAVDWQVASNTVIGDPADNQREPDTRYLHLLSIFQAEKGADPYYPLYPNYVDRRFNLDREIPEKTVEKLFVDLLTSDEFKVIGALVKERLGRDLQPFDIWYNGFQSKSVYSEDELDQIVKQRFPGVKAFETQVPEILKSLGFKKETADFLAAHIEVDPARGAGHAMGAGRRIDKAHLRTRVPENGMNYKGFNIAMHELGHNVEQVFSMSKIDHTLLEGVPNTAFTEAFAFIFQARDLDVLGLGKKDPMSEHMTALNSLWATCEIAGVSLVDMAVWHWMYEHPEASSAELRKATIQIAKEIWNKYFYPVLGHQDAIILAIYSHMIDAGLYLPDYPVGHIIQFQIEDYIKDKNLAVEMERMTMLGGITPGAWMEAAVGEKISVDPLLKAAKKALKSVQ
jgi:hypothetical protein